MKEMDENAEYYADQFLHRATIITEVDSLSLSVNCLLMQALGKEASGVFSQCLQEKLSPREAFVHGLRSESAVRCKIGEWSGMAEIAALATVLGRILISVYPSKFTLACQATFSPRLSEGTGTMALDSGSMVSQSECHIMWSCSGNNLLHHRNPQPTHFVPLVKLSFPSSSVATVTMASDAASVDRCKPQSKRLQGMLSKSSGQPPLKKHRQGSLFSFLPCSKRTVPESQADDCCNPCQEQPLISTLSRTVARIDQGLLLPPNPSLDDARDGTDKARGMKLKDMQKSLQTVPCTKKRKVTVNTVNKWISDHDRSMNTTQWLHFDSNGTFVTALKCTVCIQFEEKLIGCRNFTRSFIRGSTNLQSSSFKEHSKSFMHRRAMILLRQTQSQHVTEYSPITKSLTTLDIATEAKIRRKFDVAYSIANRICH